MSFNKKQEFQQNSCKICSNKVLLLRDIVDFDEMGGGTMKRHAYLRIIAACLCAAAVCGAANGCSSSKPQAKETVTIYPSIEDYRIEIA